MANKMFRVNVTAADIKRGFRRSCYSCPVAIAVRRALHRRYITVGGTEVWLKREYLTRLPRRAVSFVGNFDHHMRVRPFSFVLHVPAARLSKQKQGI